MNSAIITAQVSRSAHFLKLSDQAALLVLMMLPHCDDYGRIIADPDHIAINVCPSRWALAQVETIIDEILTKRDKKGESILTAYEFDGQRYLYYTNWFRYQRLGSNYTARAVCPHPVLGIVEPNVLGKTLSGFFHAWLKRDPSKRADGTELQEYNRAIEPVNAFLEQGLYQEEKPKSAQKDTDSAQIDHVSAHIEDESTQTCAETPPISESPAQVPRRNDPNLRRKGVSSSPAPAPAPATSPATSPAPSPPTPSTICADRPPSWPESVADVAECLNLSGHPEAWALDCWRHFEPIQWVGVDNKPLRNWRVAVRQWGIRRKAQPPSVGSEPPSGASRDVVTEEDLRRSAEIAREEDLARCRL